MTLKIKLKIDLRKLYTNNQDEPREPITTQKQIGVTALL